MYLVTKGGCCGLGEIDGVSEPGTLKQKLLGLLSDTLYGAVRRYAFVQPALIFTGSGRAKTPPKYSEDFKAYLEANKLGKVTMIPIGRSKNSNSGNYIFVYHWTVDKDRLRAWRRKNRTTGR